nr:ataxin-10 [Leptinotarsa decemlineata]
MLQFLMNLTTSNRKVTQRIKELFYDDIRKSFQKNVCLYECSALLYNISLFISIGDQETVEKILDLYGSEEHNEFLCFFLENSISSSGLWTNYINLKLENRLKILDFLKEMQIENRLQVLPDIGLEILIQKFLECGEVLLQINGRNSLEVYEISSSLEILSSLSSKEEYLKKLQTNKDVLVNAGALLINIHRLGKVSNNSFTPIQKIFVNGSENSELNIDPVFGFKTDLVRLIGNMCWKNFELQNLARTAEIIPVILDSCNIDAKNPFIMQWCILAIRNLCENNIENQKVIAGLHQEGTVSNEVLDEMGIALHTDGKNQLKIVNLESLRK